VNERAAAKLKLFQKGSVLFTKSGASLLLNQRAILGRDMHVVSHIGVAVPGPRIMSEWLYYWLCTLDFADIAHGANMPSLPLARVKQLRVPVPPVPEQLRRVAEIEKQFSRLDEAVANLKRVKANIKRYKSAVLKAAVEGRLVQTEAEVQGREGGSYETGSQLLARVLLERRRRWIGKGTYQDPAGPGAEGLPPLPEGWAWARLDAVAALKGGITVDKKRRDSTARSVAYLRVANVQRGYLDLGEVKEIEAPQADIEELRLQPGDILFNEGGDRDKLGRGWIWEGQLAECIHQNHVFRARPYLPKVSGKLISWWGNTFGKDYFLREGKQTTNLASINMTKLSAFPVPIPPDAEQRRIVAEVDRRLSIVREVEAEVDAKLSGALFLKRAVLARSFCS
jgi:type I restriction enzyme S subunit